jgi:protein TIF31
VNADFVDTAIKGAKQIVKQSIAPINSHMPEAYHMWLQNGIVFTYALDNDFLVLQRLRQKQEIEKKDAEKEGRTITRPPPHERGGRDGPSLEETEENTPEAEAKSPGRGLRAGGVLQSEKDVTSYASANADLKGHRAVETADVSGGFALPALHVARDFETETRGGDSNDASAYTHSTSYIDCR